MAAQIGTPMITAQKVLELALTLPPTEQRWLAEQFTQLIEDELPESATVDEAMGLYLANQCSLARAAELAQQFGTGFALTDAVKAAIRKYQPTY